MARRVEDFPQLIGDKITKQTTITAGSTEFVALDCPKEANCFLKGIGYTWYTSNTYVIDTGEVRLPKRTDQLGSASIPHQWESPFPCEQGGQFGIWITNGDSSDHTYDVVFYILTDRFLKVESAGGELIIATGGGSTAGNVAIYNSSGTTAANVTAKGLEVEPQSPATLLAGQKTATTSAAALATSTDCKKVTVQADPANSGILLVGNSSGQYIQLYATQAVDIDIDDLAKVYVKAQSGTQVANYIGS